ncbi:MULTISPECIES: hypothetical protein [Xanthomonas]|uniref:Scaffolding protein n=2 Tax=Xanthomonas TaxID=338 RepID=A0A7Z7IYJ2_XANCH|nr:MULTISPECIES: hypothetical protein [Xanthomonas]ATS39256.1 hypothetical protein XcfCFBP6988P_14935 [Xanthomonas citri pv. phaseoli var. fuscans]ATS41937.1 hypothetical protein XcfCFBP6989P_05555 [Xanthomonas citri pv. phaseoli var. fuscans]ATS47259.1 hypothetical protein XcfCFBP6990P_11805 [Xanthomonas citri pv. phaseoli var. fuscans]ATS86362.1 hypothetical protein XcfCFBP6991P_22425 [Xanthomonas citri pv. phaseoli var. fuscans]QWN20901.1 hypothetical protein DGM98_12870 [Xanthomonas citri]
MNERLQAAIAAIEASNPKPQAEASAVTHVDNATPAGEQGNSAATVDDDQQIDDTDDSGESAASDGNDAPAQRQNKGVGKRINELTREKYEALRRAEAAERRAQELEQQGQPHATGKDPVQSDSRPTLDQFNYDQDAYLEALTDWRVSQRLNERDSQQQVQQKRHQEQERQREFQGRLASFEAENPGKWEAATKAPINFTEPMLEVIASSEVGPSIAVYLAENLDRADEISRMTPYAQAAALGRIEASVSAPKPPQIPPHPKTVTKAPAVVPTIHGTAVAKKDAASMTFEDHVAKVREQHRR